MPTLALAHVGQGDVSGGFIAGFEHPILGLDHVVAMIAVGLWGAQLGPPAIWVLPVTFPLVMALGGLLGGLGVELPSVEIGIATSAVVLGAMVTLAMRPPLWVAGVLVGLFAIFHGYAHGAELPESANPLTYALGFVVATGSLHLVGITLGLANRWSWGTRSLQAGGAVIASCGVYFLLPHLAGA
ncbi:MAG: HupE/UreJ family protein [Candidatus Contendobacter sp.]|nr:HupE/UreJ family protein [Candidatus Contendobacter sp.]